MKGIVLAGGTATRLFPLTIVTNKHLLPIYDRPMIYYPIETLAGMGIREVMVIVGGKSVGDVVELLADGVALRARPDVPLPAGRARDRPCDRPRARLRRRRRVLLRPRRQHPARAGPRGRRRRLRDAGRTAPGRCSTGCRTRSGSGSPSSTRTGASSGSRRSPTAPKSDLIPIGVYFLRPDAFEVIEQLAPSGRGEFEITDVLNHYIPGGRLFTRVYEGHWTDAGTVPSLLRAAELARDDDAAGRLAPPVERPLSADRGATSGRFDRLLVTGGAGFIGSCFVRDVLGPPRRHARSPSSTS